MDEKRSQTAEVAIVKENTAAINILIDKMIIAMDGLDHHEEWVKIINASLLGVEAVVSDLVSRLDQLEFIQSNNTNRIN